MKPLVLTPQHKSKILEMCKVLFPEQVFGWEYEMSGRALGIEVDTILYSFTNDEFWNAFNIHWFELQWKILNKLCEVKQLSPIDVKNQVLLYGLVCFNQSTLLHPVDYLYAIFKEKE